MSIDSVTEFARRAVNVLFVADQRATAMGVLLGVVLDGIARFSAPIVQALIGLNLDSVEAWHLIAFGVFVMNLSPFFSRKKVDRSIVEAIDFIEAQSAQGKIKEWQKRQLYASLLNKVLENALTNSTIGGKEPEPQQNRGDGSSNYPSTRNVGGAE